MNLRFVRRVATLLIALFVFAQGSVVFAACGMDRASMAQAMTMASDVPCDCGETQQPVTATCVAHCTADLQLMGSAIALVHGFASAPILLVVMPAVDPGRTALHSPPPVSVPRRILLHSFLI